VTGKHIAVVPVADFDPPTRRVLVYADSLAGQVLAVHVRAEPRARPRNRRGGADSANGAERAKDERGMEERWAAGAPEVPLLVLPASAPSWQWPFVQALRALKRSERPDLITVVMPNPTLALRLALLLTPGVALKASP
jgi:hypothetical protein